MKNPINNIKSTILFLVLYFFLIVLVDKLLPGDMCNPEGGFLMVLLFIPIILVMIFIRILKY